MAHNLKRSLTIYIRSLYMHFIIRLSKRIVGFTHSRPLTDELAKTLTPVFVLSTGRCGTKWLSVLLSSSRVVFPNHSLQPELVRESKLAYEKWPNNLDNLIEIIRSARDDLISFAYRNNRVYVETNNRIVFFAYALSIAYPKSKFIHLYRHPADFVISGMRRNWYLGDPHDIGRINMKSPEQWKKMTQLEKIAWLWNETNIFIEHFLSNLQEERWMSLSSEQMFSDKSSVLDMCEFIGAKDISSKRIAKLQNKRINEQKQGDFPKYDEWPQKHKQQLRNWCTLTSKYGYDFF